MITWRPTIRMSRGLPLATFLMILLTVAIGYAEQADARNVYLNGVDISAARAQELKKVDIVINERGDVYIIAPHYQVNEEDTYIPLSRYVHTLRKPTHKGQPTMLHKPEAGADNATSEEIQQGYPNRLQDKAGDEVPAEPLPGHPNQAQGQPVDASSQTPASSTDTGTTTTP